MQVILYQSAHKGEKGLFLSSSSKKTKAKASNRFFRNLGLGLIIGSAVLFFVATGPVITQEIAYRLLSRSTPLAEEEKPGFSAVLEQIEEQRRRMVADEAASYGVPTDFSLVIPKIKAASKVIPNVNPGNEEDYKTYLMEGIGHAAGSKFPGSKGTIYLFSHSNNSLANISRYNAVFYSLKDLEPGDEIIIFFAGKKFVYQATEKIITKADDLKWLTDEAGEERLVLQTCWPPGTSLKRLLIVAKPV